VRRARAYGIGAEELRGQSEASRHLARLEHQPHPGRPALPRNLVVPGNRCGLKVEDFVEDADVSFTAGSVDKDLGLAGANPFESLLRQTTLLRHVSGGLVARPQLPYENYRGRIHDTLEVIKALPPPMSPSSSSPGSSPLIRRSSSPPTALWSRQVSPSHSALN
jgi:hypothetical protein